jgi:hypothetical protein
MSRSLPDSTPGNANPAPVNPIRDGIREILLTDWDPHNAGRFEAARGEYDGYIEPLRELIQSGAGEDAVVAYLHEREQETMCFPALGTRRLLPVARKLIRLRT